MASLFKRRGSFYLDFYSQTRVPRRKQVRLIVRTRRDAEAVRAQMESAYALGNYDPWIQSEWPPASPDEPRNLNSDATLGEAISAFLESRGALRKATVDHYRWVLTAFSKHVGPDRILSRIPPADIVQWLSQAHLSDDSVYTYWTRILIFARWLSGQGVAIPVESISVAKPSDKLPRKLLTVEQVEDLITAARRSSTPYLADVISLTFCLALRLGEVCALKWEWVDLRRGVVVVQSDSYFKTKTGRSCVKPLTDQACELLVRLKAQGSSSGFVLRNGNGTPMTAKYTSKVFKRLTRSAGLPEAITFHSLRHAALSTAAAHGASLESVRLFAGHSTVAMSMKYVHLTAGQYAESIRDAMP